MVFVKKITETKQLKGHKNTYSRSVTLHFASHVRKHLHLPIHQRYLGISVFLIGPFGPHLLHFPIIPRFNRQLAFIVKNNRFLVGQSLIQLFSIYDVLSFFTYHVLSFFMHHSKWGGWIDSICVSTFRVHGSHWKK